MGLGGGLDHGVAGVAAGAYHQVGPEAPQDGPGGTARRGQHPQGVEVVAQPLAVETAAEAADLHGGIVVARLRYQLPLHAGGRTHEQDRGIRVFLPHIAGQGQRRVDVSRSTTAGKNDSHAVTPLRRMRRRGRLYFNTSCNLFAE